MPSVAAQARFAVAPAPVPGAVSVTRQISLFWTAKLAVVRVPEPRRPADLRAVIRRWPTAQQSWFDPIDSRPRCIFMHHET
jgi:hypothetical protein